MLVPVLTHVIVPSLVERHFAEIDLKASAFPRSAPVGSTSLQRRPAVQAGRLLRRHQSVLMIHRLLHHGFAAGLSRAP